MMAVSVLSFVILALGVSCASGTKVEQCSSIAILDIQNRTFLGNCENPPCALVRGTNQSLELKFKPAKAIATLTNYVKAKVWIIWVSYPGVHAKNICDKVYSSSSPDTKVGCPLDKDVEYIYKDEFEVMSNYPSLDVRVHWALRDEADANVSCFEVDVAIV